VNGFLLDTHVLLWFIQKDPQLSDRVREVIADDANLLFLSAASLWEIAFKINIGKLKSVTRLISYTEFLLNLSWKFWRLSSPI
jgi:PIN domain nuclease of toxin-antitoxin system